MLLEPIRVSTQYGIFTTCPRKRNPKPGSKLESNTVFLDQGRKAQHGQYPEAEGFTGDDGGFHGPDS